MSQNPDLDAGAGDVCARDARGGRRERRADDSGPGARSRRGQVDGARREPANWRGAKSDRPRSSGPHCHRRWSERRRPGRGRQSQSASRRHAGDAADRARLRGGRVDVALLHPQSVPHRGHLPDRNGDRVDQRRPDAGRPVSRDQHPGGGRSRPSTAACRRSRSKPTSPAGSNAFSPSAPASITWSRGRSRGSASSRCFQPGTDADSDVNEISNLAMADLRRLPPGTLPPIVQKFDASSLPVCLITLKGEGLNETALRDLGAVHRPQPAGRGARGRQSRRRSAGRARQIMVYVDPARLNAYALI